MAITKITPSTSRVSVGDAFGPFPNDDSTGPDTLIVDLGAYLISQFGNGAFLANTGAWTVKVNGSIVSQNSNGIFVAFGNAAVSTIKIGVDGEVRGGFTGAGVFLGSSANLNNAGAISGGIFGIEVASSGPHAITNSGTITALTAIHDASGTSNDTVRNSGTINGSLFLSGGNDTVTNSGSLFGQVLLGDGTNRLTNSGKIDGSMMSISSGSGADTVTNFAMIGDVIKSGIITGTVFLGDGNDKFTGGANPETVQDGNGADIVSLGGGNDTYIATGSTGTDGIDVIKGGAGIDTYDAGFAFANTSINLDTVAHDFTSFIPGGVLVAANTATGTDIAGAAKDSIFGFENAKGSSGNDLIAGSAAANTLNGGNGNDVLAGFGGNDTLDGGDLSDLLVGGSGKDQLTGGPGFDVFLYTALSDSGITAATRDLIADFDSGSDQIDLQLIDANKTTAADDAFDFIGTNPPTGFTGTPGQLLAFWSAIGQIIQGDVNGDAKPDFSIEIADPTHAITLTGANFVL
jgi:hypothetical protein